MGNRLALWIREHELHKWSNVTNKDLVFLSILGQKKAEYKRIVHWFYSWNSDIRVIRVQNTKRIQDKKDGNYLPKWSVTKEKEEK